MLELAHGVGRVYESPLPTWLYGLGAAITVLLSFFLRAAIKGPPKDHDPKVLVGASGARVTIAILKWGAFTAFFLTLLAGALVRDRGLSLAPLLFWVGLIVGVSILSTVVDGVWRAAD